LVTLLLSVPLALEYEAICQLPEHRLATGLSTKDVDMFVNTLIGLAEPVDVHFLCVRSFAIRAMKWFWKLRRTGGPMHWLLSTNAITAVHRRPSALNFGYPVKL
jgi:hypothetical protein